MIAGDLLNPRILNKNISSQLTFGGFFCSIRQSLHGVSGASRLSDGFRNLNRLPLVNFLHGNNGLFQPTSLKAEDQKLCKEDQGADPGEYRNPPVVKPFLELVFLIFLSVSVYLNGRKDLNCERRLKRVALVFSDFGRCGGGLGLWFATFHAPAV